MSTVIKVENLSKQYRLGEIGTGSLSHDINRWWHQVRGKENPYLKIGEANDRSTKGESEYVWSLKDINFEIEQGDAVGIIGRNGAGKSTLLKILSRVTGPTTGSVKVKGRIASLLEVGTGFHPELSGRDNIFLNGAILGMRKQEIQRKFDEIVDFSGVERYIDTPVKRYSSGMYVRLAFAVAAHLESEILIVDEVLAVGDAEFQKKCLGKMNDVSKGEGRTVLFVSHNMGSVKSLCEKGILLDKGSLKYAGLVTDIVQEYNRINLQNFKINYSFKAIEQKEASYGPIKIHEINSLVNNDIPKTSIIDVYDQLSFLVNWECTDIVENYSLFIQCNKNDDFYFGNFEISKNNNLLGSREKGNFCTEIIIPSPLFKPGSYSFDFHISKIGQGSHIILKNAISIEVDLLNINPRFTYAAKERPGEFVVEPIWITKKI